MWKKRRVSVQSKFILWVRQRSNPTEHGPTPKNVSLVYGPSNSGKKTAISKILKEEGFFVITITDKRKVNKPETFVHHGVCGKHAYIVDVDNMQGFPRISSKKLDDVNFRAPIVYVCVDPFVKTKGISWRDIQKDFAIFQSGKDYGITKYLKRGEPTIGSLPHKKDPFLLGTPPWVLMTKITSPRADLTEKLQAVGSDPKRVFNILRTNALSICSEEDIEKARAYTDILCNMDKQENLAKKAFLFGDPGEYQASAIVQCASALDISSRTKLSYKSKHEPSLTRSLSSRDKLYCRESFPSLYTDDGQSKGRKRRANNKGKGNTAKKYGRFSLV